MDRGRRTRRSPAVAVVAAIVFVASAFILLRPAPEHLVATSADGVVRVSGLAISDTTLTVEKLTNVQVPVDGAVGAVYELSLSRGRLQDGEVVISLLDDRDPTTLSLYTFDRTTLSWIALPTLANLADATLTTPMTFSGSALIVVGVAVHNLPVL